ncbi:LPS O-antigen chain length determinant protein WzzB, partial [Salmonella enterica]|nr:LPS O-antigen chain length determinant protein WzzB [Salmonella enterica]
FAGWWSASKGKISHKKPGVARFFMLIDDAYEDCRSRW